MTQTHAKCNKCGREAIVMSIDAIRNRTDHDSKAAVVITIDCPNCGERDQSEATLKLRKSTGSVNRDRPGARPSWRALQRANELPAFRASGNRNNQAKTSEQNASLRLWY